MTIISFREIPALMEIEDWIARERGVAWRPEFEKKVDEVAAAVFGITRTRCHPAEPTSASFSIADEYLAANDKHQAWERQFMLPANAPEGWDNIDFLDALGIDIWDNKLDELKCAEWFLRPAIAAIKGIEGATFTPDGSGHSSSDADAWGAALAADAARFKPSR